MLGMSLANDYLAEQQKEEDKPGFLQRTFPIASGIIGAGVDAIGDMQEQGTTGSGVLDTGLNIAGQIGSGLAQDFQDHAESNLIVRKNDQDKFQLPAGMQAKLDKIENPHLRAQREAKIRAAANKATAGGGGTSHLRSMGYTDDQIKWMRSSQPKSDLQSNMVATGGGNRASFGSAPGGINRWFTAAGGGGMSPAMMTPQQLAMMRRNAYRQRRQQRPPAAAPGAAPGAAPATAPATAPTPTLPTPEKKPDLDWDKIQQWGQDAWGWLT